MGAIDELAGPPRLKYGVIVSIKMEMTIWPPFVRDCRSRGPDLAYPLSMLFMTSAVQPIPRSLYVPYFLCRDGLSFPSCRCFYEGA